MPGKSPVAPAHVRATAAAKGVAKPAAVAKSKKPGCGSGAGGFKPGNTCGKTGQAKRQVLADKIRALRGQAKGSAGETKAVRELALELKKHRRGTVGAITNDRAKEHLAALDGKGKVGQPKGVDKAAITKSAATPAKSGAKPATKPATPAKPAKETTPVARQPDAGHGMTKAKVEFETKAHERDFAEAARRIFDRPVTHADVATLAGVPDAATATISVNPGHISVTSDHGGVYVHRIIARDHAGKTYIKNDVFTVSKDQQGKGIGLQVFGRQVEHARRLGIDRIETVAARSYDTENRQGLVGYKVWPKFGYDAVLADVTSDRNRRTLPKGLKKAKRISDLMKSPEGRAWWEENGGSAEMSFDLKSGSLSNRVWDAYRGTKQGTK